jgi:hypothetical protein
LLGIVYVACDRSGLEVFSCRWRPLYLHCDVVFEFLEAPVVLSYSYCYRLIERLTVTFIPNVFMFPFFELQCY